MVPPHRHAATPDRGLQLLLGEPRHLSAPEPSRTLALSGNEVPV